MTSPPAFDFQGTARDAEALTVWAAMAGAAARPALEGAFVDGSPVVRAAAALALAALDTDIAPALAEAALDVVTARGDDPRDLVVCLASAGAGAALDAVLERLPEGEDGETVGGEPSAAERGRIVSDGALAVARLLSAWRALDGDARRARFDALHIRVLATRTDVAVGPLRRVLCLALDDAALRELQRERAAEALFTLGSRGDVDSMRALAARSSSPFVPGVLVVAASLAADPIEAFEELNESYSVDAYRRRVIARALDSRADPRWVDAALAVMDIDAEAATATLAHLGTPRAAEELLQLAAGAVLDDVTKHALAALGPLGDARGGALLMAWLARAEAAHAAPLLLTALARCGGADALPFLEARREGPGAAYVRHAIDAIRARI